MQGPHRRAPGPAQARRRPQGDAQAGLQVGIRGELGLVMGDAVAARHEDQAGRAQAEQAQRVVARHRVHPQGMQALGLGTGLGEVADLGGQRPDRAQGAAAQRHPDAGLAGRRRDGALGPGGRLGQDAVVVRADLDGEDRLRRYHVGGVRRDQDAADRGMDPVRPGLRHGPQRGDEQGRRVERVPAPAHPGRPGMGLLAGEHDLDLGRPPVAGDETDPGPGLLQDRALLDMEFEVAGGERGRGVGSERPDRRQGLAERDARVVAAAERGLRVVVAGIDPAAEEARPEPGSLLVGPVHRAEIGVEGGARPAGPHQRRPDGRRRRDPVGSVEAPRPGLAVEMRAQHHHRGIRDPGEPEEPELVADRVGAERRPGLAQEIGQDGPGGPVLGRAAQPGHAAAGRRPAGREAGEEVVERRRGGVMVVEGHRRGGGVVVGGRRRGGVRR